MYLCCFDDILLVMSFNLFNSEKKMIKILVKIHLLTKKGNHREDIFLSFLPFKPPKKIYGGKFSCG